MQDFKHLQVVEPILKALATEGYTHPTPIQKEAIPIILNKKDLLGCAQTGTGKTGAFGIPILQLLSESHNSKAPAKIRCLVLTPTRELAIQIGESFSNYGRHLPLKTFVIFGGVPQNAQTKALQRGVDILIATPGRLLDLMQQGFISLKTIEIFVLDEADRMLDMGFINDVKKVVAKLPTRRQTLFFSATMPQEIQKLSNTILYKPEKVEVTPASSTADTVEQCLYFVSQKEKKDLLIHLLQSGQIGRVLVFMRTKHGSDKLAKDLKKVDISADAIHGNKSQNNRQRALAKFKASEIQVLIATDIAARGIDIDDLAHVINYDLSDVAETYVHRIGRTGRAGLSGSAIAFCDSQEMDNLKGIQKLIGFKIPVVENHPFVLKGSSDIVNFRAPKNKDVVPPRNYQRKEEAGTRKSSPGNHKEAPIKRNRTDSPSGQRPYKKTSNAHHGKVKSESTSRD